MAGRRDGGAECVGGGSRERRLRTDRGVHVEQQLFRRHLAFPLVRLRRQRRQLGQREQPCHRQDGRQHVGAAARLPAGALRRQPDRHVHGACPQRLVPRRAPPHGKLFRRFLWRRRGQPRLQRSREQRPGGREPRHLLRRGRSLARALPPVRGHGGRRRQDRHQVNERQGQRALVRRRGLRLRLADQARLVLDVRRERVGGRPDDVERQRGRPPLLHPARRERGRAVDGPRDGAPRECRILHVRRHV